MGGLRVGSVFLDAGVCGREEVGEAGGRRGGRVVGADGERVLWLLDDTMSFFLSFFYWTWGVVNISVAIGLET